MANRDGPSLHLAVVLLGEDKDPFLGVAMQQSDVKGYNVKSIYLLYIIDCYN